MKGLLGPWVQRTSARGGKSPRARQLFPQSLGPCSHDRDGAAAVSWLRVWLFFAWSLVPSGAQAAAHCPLDVGDLISQCHQLHEEMTLGPGVPRVWDAQGTAGEVLGGHPEHPLRLPASG